MSLLGVFVKFNHKSNLNFLKKNLKLKILRFVFEIMMIFFSQNIRRYESSTRFDKTKVYIVLCLQKSRKPVFRYRQYKVNHPF